MENNLCKEVREQLGITQVEFADMFSIPLRTVQNWEYRKNMPVYMYLAIQKIIDLQVIIYHLKNGENMK